MNAVGYIRVSTTEQAASGYGLDVQEQELRSYCVAHGLRLAYVYADRGISGTGTLDERPGLAQALAAIDAEPAQGLVVYRLDRLARDLVLQELLLERLRKAGAAVLSATEPDLDTLGDDPTKILIRQILGALGQYERALIRGRMSAGRAAKAAVGGYVGGAPAYGFRAHDGALATHAKEAAAVAMIAELSSQGRSLRHICAALDAAGHRPRRAERWHPAVVRDILRRQSD